jgi:hypothetical protein
MTVLLLEVAATAERIRPREHRLDARVAQPSTGVEMLETAACRIGAGLSTSDFSRAVRVGQRLLLANVESGVMTMPEIELEIERIAESPTCDGRLILRRLA